LPLGVVEVTTMYNIYATRTPWRSPCKMAETCM